MKTKDVSGHSDSIGSDSEFGMKPVKKKGIFGRFDFPSLSDVLGWTVTPALRTVVVILVDNQLLLPIEPGSI